MGKKSLLFIGDPTIEGRVRRVFLKKGIIKQTFLHLKKAVGRRSQVAGWNWKVDSRELNSGLEIRF